MKTGTPIYRVIWAL